MSSELPVVATIHALFSGPMNIVVILGTVALQLTPSFSRIGVRWLIATLMMIKQAPLHALVVLTMMLSSAHESTFTDCMLVCLYLSKLLDDLVPSWDPNV